jgi:hypothetical protein
VRRAALAECDALTAAAAAAEQEEHDDDCRSCRGVLVQTATAATPGSVSSSVKQQSSSTSAHWIYY